MAYKRLKGLSFEITDVDHLTNRGSDGSRAVVLSVYKESLSEEGWEQVFSGDYGVRNLQKVIQGFISEWLHDPKSFIDLTNEEAEGRW